MLYDSEDWRGYSQEKENWYLQYNRNDEKVKVICIEITSVFVLKCRAFIDDDDDNGLRGL